MSFTSTYTKSFFLILLFVSLCRGGTVVDATGNHVNVTEKACYLEDPNKSMDFESFGAVTKEQQCEVGGKAAGFNFSGSAFWFRFDLENGGQEEIKRLLTFEPTWLDRIDLRLISPSGARSSFQGGDRYPYSERAFTHPNTAFELGLEPGVSTVLVRVETRDPFVVMMELWEERTFFKSDSGYSSYIGFLYGILIAMAIYNLFLFLTLRERVNVYYVLYILLFMAMNFTYSGYAFPLLWPESPEWGNWAHSIIIYLYVLSGLLFMIVFLETKKRLPRAHRWVLGYMALMGVTFIVTIFSGGYAHHVLTSIFFIIPFTLIAFVLGVVSWVRGNRTARFFVMGTTAGLLGATITALTVSSFLPFNFFTYRAADIGYIFDAMLLSIALADRYRMLRVERDALRYKEMRQVEIIRQKEAFAEELEERVQTALQENRKQEAVMLRQFEQAALGEMIGVIAHQLKQPLNAISLYIHDMVDSFHHGDLDRKTVDRVQDGAWKSIMFMSQTIDDFRNFFRPDKQKKSFLLKDAVEMITNLLSKQLAARGVEIEVSIDQTLRVESYENELQQVLLNLLSNASDVFHERRIASPKITITAERSDRAAVICVEDNGGGIPDEVLPRVFEQYYTTKGEVGTGLGLYMSKMIVNESLGGEIRVENGENGARFIIVL